MKGGTLIVCGDVGRWAGKMTLGGRIVVLGDTACLHNEVIADAHLFAGRLLGYLADMSMEDIRGAAVDMISGIEAEPVFDPPPQHVAQLQVAPPVAALPQKSL